MMALRQPGVVPWLKKLQSEAGKYVETLGSVQDSAKETGATLNNIGDTDMVNRVRRVYQETVLRQAEVAACSSALGQLADEYELDEDTETDFAAVLAAKRDSLKQDPRAQTEQAERLREFNVALAEAQPNKPELDDEDLMIDNTQQSCAPNATCPLSGRKVLEIEDPVQDSRGFVYERAVIERYIRSHSSNGSIMCPVAGTSHTVSLAELKKAKKVVQMQRRQQYTQSQVETQEEDVVDID